MGCILIRMSQRFWHVEEIPLKKDEIIPVHTVKTRPDHYCLATPTPIVSFLLLPDTLLYYRNVTERLQCYSKRWTKLTTLKLLVLTLSILFSPLEDL